MHAKLIENTQVQTSGGKVKLNLEAQAKGMYYVTLGNGEKVYGGKVVVD